MTTFIVGSRASALARAQVREYLAPLRVRFPRVRFVHRVLLEGGDQDRRSSLADVSASSGGSAFSTNQQDALVRGEVDVVIHSLKDLPTANPAGLILLAPPGREDVRDALCGCTLDDLVGGGRVGTSAQRRAAQLLRVRPEVEMVPIRGNVPGRLAKVASMNLDAVVLAAAGISRLGRQDEITEYLPLDLFPPSPGQGALGVQVRADNAAVREILETAGDVRVDREVRAERALLAELHGGCSVPVGAYAVTGPDGVLSLHGQVTSLDGRRRAEGTVTGPAAEPERLGLALAVELLEQGAAEILDAIRGRQLVG